MSITYPITKDQLAHKYQCHKNTITRWFQKLGFHHNSGQRPSPRELQAFIDHYGLPEISPPRQLDMFHTKT
jgi:hypothetical protein